jgi:hypothetical protein
MTIILTVYCLIGLVSGFGTLYILDKERMIDRDHALLFLTLWILAWPLLLALWILAWPLLLAVSVLHVACKGFFYLVDKKSKK